MLVQVICEQCQKEFSASKTSYQALGCDRKPKVCPTCKDRNDPNKSSVVISREALLVFDEVENRLPPTWFIPKRNGTLVSCIAALHGCPHADGQRVGRIDVFALWPATNMIPKRVRVRVMRSVSEHKLNGKQFTRVYLVLEPVVKREKGELPILRYWPETAHSGNNQEVFWSYELENVNYETGKTLCRGFLEII